jgi:putative ABC transport system permease protein
LLGASNRQIALFWFREHVVALTWAWLFGGVSLAASAQLLESTARVDIGQVIWHPRILVTSTIGLTLVCMIGGTWMSYRTCMADRSSRQRWARGRLIGVQTAIGVCLVSAALVAGKSVRAIVEGAGLEVDELLIVTGDVFADGYRSNDDLRRRFEAVGAEVAQTRGVASTAVASSDLLWINRSADIAYLTTTTEPSAVPGIAVLHAVDGAYLETVGSVLTAGRSLTADDELAGRSVAVIDESLANGFWPEVAPLGRCVFFMRSSQCLEVVGVVKTRGAQLLVHRRAEIFVPLRTALALRPDLIVRSLLIRLQPGVSNAGLSRTTNAAMRAQGLGGLEVTSVADVARQQTATVRQTATVTFTTGLLALAASIAGFFSSFAVLVSQQTKEIAVRRAIGASGRWVILPIVTPLAVAVVLGIVGGGVAFVLTSRVLASVVHFVPVIDGSAIGLAAAALCLTAAVGAIVPAARAVRIAPASVLRDHQS